MTIISHLITISWNEPGLASSHTRPVFYSAFLSTYPPLSRYLLLLFVVATTLSMILFNLLALPDIKRILCPHLRGFLCCSKAKNYETLCLMSPLLYYYTTYSLQKPTENHPLIEKDMKINIVSLGLQTAYLPKGLHKTDRVGVFF